jgi:hypothetical protein
MALAETTRQAFEHATQEWHSGGQPPSSWTIKTTLGKIFENTTPEETVPVIIDYMNKQKINIATDESALVISEAVAVMFSSKFLKTDSAVKISLAETLAEIHEAAGNADEAASLYLSISLMAKRLNLPNIYQKSINRALGMN